MRWVVLRKGCGLTSVQMGLLGVVHLSIGWEVCIAQQNMLVWQDNRSLITCQILAGNLSYYTGLLFRSLLVFSHFRIVPMFPLHPLLFLPAYQGFLIPPTSGSPSEEVEIYQTTAAD
jgi:hypothetical protein